MEKEPKPQQNNEVQARREYVFRRNMLNCRIALEEVTNADLEKRLTESRDRLNGLIEDILILDQEEYKRKKPKN